MEDNENNNVFPTEGDRNINNKYALTDDYQESILYNETSDRESSENLNSQEDTERQSCSSSLTCFCKFTPNTVLKETIKVRYFLD